MKEKILRITDTGLIKFSSLTAVTGNTLASKLDIPHKNMMRCINRAVKKENIRKSNELKSELIKSEFNAVFKEWNYKDSRGRNQKTFLMNEDALYLAITESKSQNAHNIKVMFKSKFNNMRRERELREVAKCETKSANDNLKLLSEQLKKDAPDSSKGVRVFLHVQQKINAVISGSCKKLERDTLNDADLELINRLENTTHKLIGMMLDTFGSIVTRVHLLSLLECYKNNKRLISY